MTSFNTPFDWDTNLPPSISTLDENDFLLLLQKQFPVVNTGDLSFPSASLFKEKPVSESNSQSLNKFRLPQSNSPTSSDSSPSPPSPNDDASANGSTDNGHKKSDTAEEDHHKRKASADDFEDDIGGQPSNKTQHMDSKSKKPGGSIRRKSSGGERTQDESRLLKRKEQNRAAQRAFRERKEKHVKDLEDKVAQLEAKTESQEAENENLRDMLSRLQSENLMLKQTAFTFSVPSSSNTTPTSSINKHGASTPERRKSSGATSESLNLFSSNVPGPSSVPASAGSSIASASTHDSPSSIFETFDSFSNMQNAEASSSVSTSANNPNPNPNPTSSTTDLDTIAYFGAPGPFTTISSNPLFTSYRDPMASMNAFASFGGWEGDVPMAGASATQDNSNAGLDGLFGDQFSGLIPFSGDFLNGETSASAASSGSSPAARLSPVAHHKTKPTAEAHSSGTCPKTKGDIERLVATGGRSTFGSPPPSMDETRNSTPAANPPPGAPGRQSEYDAAVDRAFGMAPKKDCTDNSSIDDLCLEMQRKARCSYAATAWSQ